jgi:hypothetical protein
MRRTILALLSTAAFAACGNVKPSNTDAAQATDASDTDGEVTDAGIDTMPPIDSGIDGGPPSAGQELTTAGGHVSGPTFSMDVQIGHPTSQEQITGGTYRLEANTPIKP